MERILTIFNVNNFFYKNTFCIFAQEYAIMGSGSTG